MPIKRGPSGKFREVAADGNVIREFPPKVWIERDETGRIVALHRIAFSHAFHVEGLSPIENQPGITVEDLTDILDQDRRPVGAVDDKDIVDNFDFNPSDRTFSRRP